MKAWLILLIVGLVALALAALPAFLGVMGLLGIVADASPAENRQVGWGFLRIALYPALPGVLLIATAIWLRLRSRRG